MIKNFAKLEKTIKEIGAGGIICFYDTFTKLDENNYIIPISNVINYSSLPIKVLSFLTKHQDKRMKF